MPIDTTALSVEDQSALLSAGLITPDNELTPLGTISANLSEAGLDPATRAAAIRDFKSGYLNPDLSFTETGELHYMDKETAVHRGRDTFRAWYLQGGWDRHKDSQPDNPFYKQVGDAVKALSTKTIPQAIEGAALAVGSATGIYKFFGQDDVQESVDATVGASSGMFLKEMARNTAMMTLGNNLVWAKAYTAATGDNEPEISALYDFERGMSELDQTTSADAAAALTALSHVVEPDDEKAEMGMLEAAQRTREGVELVRQEVGNERLLQEYDERLASFGELAGGPELLAGGLASFVPRKVLTAGGRATAKRIASLNREIVEKTALRQTAENALKADNAAMILGRKTTVDRVALRKQVQDLSNQIDELAATAEKVANKSFAGGSLGQLRDSVRDLGNKTRSGIAGSPVGTIGTKIDNYFTAPRGLPGHAKNIVAAGGVLAVAEAGAKVLDAVNLPGGEIARFGSKALALGYLAPTLYGRAKTLARTTHAMGASYVARRSTVPYWRKVSQRMADNKLVSGAALTMDVFAKPLVPVANMGKAAGRAMVAELPFNFIASGGQEGWLAEAIAEGLVFSAPGQVQGLIHGMGGMPAVMQKAEFDQLAANDAAELRRYLPARHQQAFDSLDPSVRRIVGVYSAMFPDLEFRFQPAPGNTTGSAYDKSTDTVYIDPNSKRPFDALIAHEVAHGVQERGFDRLIIDKLVGQDGLLRNEDGSLTSDALKFKAEYESILGRQIDDETLAREWFAESSVPGLMRTQQLQRLVRRNPITRSLAESLLPKIPFGKRILQRSGILLDQNGNPVAGQGSMQALTQASPAVAQIVDRYLRTVAGTSRPSDSRVAVEKAKARPLTREERENADRRNQIDFEQEADGSQKKVNGRRVLVNNKTRRQRGAKLGQEIEKLAEEISFADPNRMPEKMSLVDKINLFNEEEWTKLIDRLEKAGIYNPSQLALFREVFKRKAIGNSESLLFDYQPAIKTKGASKRYDSREAQLITGAIYEIQVTKDKNVLLNIIDMDFLEQRAMKAAATKLGQELYPGGTAAIMRDVMILAENHVNDVSNIPIFTKPNQLNFLNGILGSLSKEHQARNPLAKGRPAVRSLRLDRINQAEGLQQKGLPFIPDSWRDNLLPEPVDQRFFGETEPVVSMENMPGMNTGVLQNLHAATPAQRQSFEESILETIADPDFGDAFGRAIDTRVKLAPLAPSVYVNTEGGIEINAAQQVGGFRSREDAELYALLRGLFMKQEAVAGNLPNPNGDKIAADFFVGTALDEAGVKKVMTGIIAELDEAGLGPAAAEDFAFYGNPEGFSLVHLGFNESITPKIRNDVFAGQVLALGIPNYKEYASDTFYLDNNWKTEDVVTEYGEVKRASPSGEAYAAEIAARSRSTGRPDLLAGLADRIGARLQGVYDSFAAKKLGEPGRQPGGPGTEGFTLTGRPLSEVQRAPESDDIRRLPEDPTALPIVEARNKDGSVKLNDKGKVVYEEINYDLLNAPGLQGIQAPPQNPKTPDYEALHYHITKKDRAAIDSLIESGALDQAALDLAEDARSAMEDPDIAAGIGWYSRMRAKLRQALGKDHQLFAELLGATSANTDVEQNFIYAFDAYRQFKAGKFGRMLQRYEEAVALFDEGTLAETMVARRIITKKAAKRLDQTELLKKWIKRYKLEPRRADGKRYGMNSAHVFNALSGNFTKIRGTKAKDKLSPKTPQFSMNLFGSSLEATIDVWAARYLRRKLYSPTVTRWRIQPKSETGVSNPDFLVGQEIFGRAASQLGMSPDDLQALMWFKEKAVWDANGWTKGAGALKSSFDEAADAFFPPNQTIQTKKLAEANRRGLNSLNFIRKRRGVESKVAKLEALAGQTGTKVTTAKRELRNAKAEFNKARKRAGVAEFLERNPQLR